MWEAGCGNNRQAGGQKVCGMLNMNLTVLFGKAKLTGLLQPLTGMAQVQSPAEYLSDYTFSKVCARGLSFGLAS